MSNNDNKRLEKKSRSKSRRRSSTRGDASRERRGDSSRVRRGDALRERNDLLAQQQADVFRTSRIDASDPRVQNRRLLLLALWGRMALTQREVANGNLCGSELTGGRDRSTWTLRQNWSTKTEAGLARLAVAMSSMWGKAFCGCESALFQMSWTWPHGCGMSDGQNATAIASRQGDSDACTHKTTRSGGETLLELLGDRTP
uniref:BZIP domain-containing protein n=1 Tax=Globodera pallida TaxID=36090 RepID=A0A183BX90_GLOPA